MARIFPGDKKLNQNRSNFIKKVANLNNPGKSDYNLSLRAIQEDSEFHTGVILNLPSTSHSNQIRGHPVTTSF